MGFYPVAPGFPYYAIGSLLFEAVTLHLQGGQTFTIKAEGASASNIYIQSAMLNDVAFDRPWITHAQIVAGGTLVFQMGSEPAPSWGSNPEHAPPSMSRVVF